MKHSMFLAPLLSERIITMFVLGYLAMVTAILLMTANPLQSPASLDFGPRSVSASTLDATEDLKTVVVEIPEVRVPAAPYIIVGQAN